MKRVVAVTAAMLAVSIGLNIWQYRQGKDRCRTKTERDTTIVWRTYRDTMPMLVRDTVLRWRTELLERVDTIGDTVRVTDTVKVRVPITQRVYDDSMYTAWVSGYKPRLDSIVVRERQLTIRETTTKWKRWNVGLQAGVGMTPKGVQPYVGAGVTYSLR